MMRRLLPLSLALVMFGASPLAAQGSTPHAKSPTTARLIGIIPGAGHMYAGETAHGLSYLGGVGLALFGTIALTEGCLVEPRTASQSCGTRGPSDAQRAVIIAGLGLWGWSIYDAGRAANRANAARGLRTSLIVAPERSWAHGHPGRAVRIGLSFGGA